ncbi:unnamed protein product, partial [Discosporangium mesarthrocarpum]
MYVCLSQVELDDGRRVECASKDIKDHGQSVYWRMLRPEFVKAGHVDCLFSEEEDDNRGHRLVRRSSLLHGLTLAKHGSRFTLPRSSGRRSRQPSLLRDGHSRPCGPGAAGGKGGRDGGSGRTGPGPGPGPGPGTSRGSSTWSDS